jgi:hypothetical protein
MIPDVVLAFAAGLFASSRRAATQVHEWRVVCAQVEWAGLGCWDADMLKDHTSLWIQKNCRGLQDDRDLDKTMVRCGLKRERAS